MGPKEMSCCGPGWADQGFGVQRHFKAMPTARSSSSQVAIDRWLCLVATHPLANPRATDSALYPHELGHAVSLSSA
jgi:hypothetical protein